MAGGTALSAEQNVVELHVVSDATGETATRVVAATEAQFPDQPFTTVRHPRVETVADLQLALARMEGRRAVAIFTIVEPTLRSAMRELCDEAAVDYCDLLAEPLAAVAKVSGTKAELRPGASPALDEGYFKRIAAIEFAVKNDDGLGRGLDAADVAIVGVSRTSKTPLSIYLGYLGWKATNVPLVKGIEPPPELFEIDPTRIVGLTIDANRLAEIRTERVELMGGDRRYADLNEIYEDLEHAAEIQKRLKCPVVDVSEISIEEIAPGSSARSSGGRTPPRAPHEAEAARLEGALGALVLPARGRDVHVLRSLHAVLVRATVSRLARRVPGAPPPLTDRNPTWPPGVSSMTSTSPPTAVAICSGAKGSASRR